MSEKENSGFKLRLFTKNDSVEFLALKNIFYPDHSMSLESFLHYENTRSEKIQHKHWVWGKDDAILCSALYTQWEEIYHPHKFVIRIYVHPDHQRNGYGAFMYDFIIEKLEPLDPIKISAQIHEPHTHSVRFLENRSFENTFKERESSLDLTAYDHKLFQDDLNFVLQQGFRIVTLTEFRKEDDRADYKAWTLERDAAPDMPWTDPITIPEFDVYKKTMIAHPKFNPDSWFLVLDGDQIAGLNNLWENEMEKGINTGLTAVHRKYRRKGIATALKHASLNWAKNRGYEWIRTDNAATNKGMLSINVRAGFKFIPAWLLFEKFLKEKK